MADETRDRPRFTGPRGQDDIGSTAARALPIISDLWISSWSLSSDSVEDTLARRESRLWSTSGSPGVIPWGVMRQCRLSSM